MNENITHAEMVAALVKPGDQIAASLTAKDADLWHAATGIMGEVCEIAEAISVFAQGEPLDVENMTEELGDIEFYLEQYRSNLGLSRDDVYAAGMEIAVTTDPLLLSTLLTIAAGNLLDQTKKAVIYRKAVERETFMQCLMAIEAQLIVLRHCCGIEHEQTLEANIAKLSVRYAGLKYSDDAAQKRADKQ